MLGLFFDKVAGPRLQPSRANWSIAKVLFSFVSKIIYTSTSSLTNSIPTSGFLMFSGGIDGDQWHEIG